MEALLVTRYLRLSCGQIGVAKRARSVAGFDPIRRLRFGAASRPASSTRPTVAPHVAAARRGEPIAPLDGEPTKAGMSGQRVVPSA